MASVADRIIQQVAERGPGGWVYTPRDFLGIGSRDAVDQALSRLVKAGKLRRIGQGLYDMPRFSGVLNRPAPADIDAAVSALARRDGVRVMADGLVAANRLGLTNAVPAKASYITDGPSRTLKIDGRTVRFRHGRPRIMQWAGRPAAPVVQALQWLGPDAASDVQVAATLRRRLRDEVKHDLGQNINDVPGWAVPLARSIVNAQAVAA